MSETEPTPLVLNVIVTEHGVNMGDHGQDVVRALAIDPDMTVVALMESVARPKYTYLPEPVWRDDVSVTIRAAMPLPAAADNADPWSGPR